MDRRNIFQIIYTFITNSYIYGFIKGDIFKGKTKNFCLPGLNCYSCPGSLGACPIGSFQSLIASAKYRVSFYALGFMTFFAVGFGRLICGWLCPFGLVQDLLFKIKTKKIKIKEKIHSKLIYLKYIILLVFVILMPLLIRNDFNISSPYFCKYICPSGTLGAGLPLFFSNSGIRAAVGLLFTWKVLILAIIIGLSIFLYRPFCKYLCPLGAFYGLFNKLSFYQMEIDKDKCIDCGKCERVCNMEIKVRKDQNNSECIRCNDCKVNCPTKAINSGFQRPFKDKNINIDENQI